MEYIKKLRESAKNVPLPVWIAGVIFPGGLTAIAVYMAWKASRKDQEIRPVADFIDQLKKEAEEDNDRS